VTDMGQIAAVASITKGDSEGAGARYNCVSVDSTQEAPCLRGLQKKQATDSGKG
jgi:hypothetical protein